MSPVKFHRSPVVLTLLIALWSVSIGWLASGAWAQDPLSIPESLPHIGTVDPVPANKRAGQAIYLDSCADCHLAIPPAVLPSETWRDILLDENHYGEVVEVLPSPQIEILWDYLQYFSRPYPYEAETQPFRLDGSQLFTAMHPGVELDRPVRLESCVSCHPGADAFDFRRVVADRAE